MRHKRRHAGYGPRGTRGRGHRDSGRTAQIVAACAVASGVVFAGYLLLRRWWRSYRLEQEVLRAPDAMRLRVVSGSGCAARAHGTKLDPPGNKCPDVPLDAATLRC